MIELIVVLVLSVLLNIFLIWYTYKTLSNLLYLSENLGSLYDIVSDFGEHLKTVYELERFYGDPTLTHLLEHSNAIREELGRYEDIFLLSEPFEDETTEEEEEALIDDEEEEA